MRVVLVGWLLIWSFAAQADDVIYSERFECEQTCALACAFGDQANGDDTALFTSLAHGKTVHLKVLSNGSSIYKVAFSDGKEFVMVVGADVPACTVLTD